MKRILAAATATLSTLLLASAASAAIIQVTAAGTIKSGADGLGLFGTAGGDLAGDSYSEVWDIDTTSGLYSSQTALPGTVNATYHSELDGGSTLGLTPPISATLTVNAVSESVDGSSLGSEAFDYLDRTGQNDFSQIATSTQASSSSTSSQSLDLHMPFNQYPYATPGNIVDPIKTPQNFSLALTGGATTIDFGSSFDFQVDNLSTKQTTATQGELYLTTYDYKVISAAGSPVSAAPEPSAWLLIITGAGMVGFALRRRSSAGQSAVAV